jgi:hypothetical protein
MRKQPKAQPSKATRKKTAKKPARPSHQRDGGRGKQRRKSAKTVERFDWQGITVAVSYEADWMGMSKELSQFATAHLEIESVAPAKQPLPVTETGYRSHFVARGIVEQAGGPVAFARAWLEQAAKAPAWKRQQEASKQLCLF